MICDDSRTVRLSCPVWVKSRKSHGEQMLAALPPKADIKRGVSHVRLVPKSGCEQSQQGSPLFDHLVGAH
jgi:hypothetical protein